MEKTLLTKRLIVEKISVADAPFIYRLLNTDGWKKFIGERNVNSTKQAEEYIEKILQRADFYYLVIKKKNDLSALGIISFLKREELENFDFGFALLPEYENFGFTFEAAQGFLENILQIPAYQKVSAVTKPENVKSIRLLEKLGFRLEKEIVLNHEICRLYSINLAGFRFSWGESVALSQSDDSSF